MERTTGGKKGRRFFFWLRVAHIDTEGDEKAKTRGESLGAGEGSERVADQKV